MAHIIISECVHVLQEVSNLWSICQGFLYMFMYGMNWRVFFERRGMIAQR